jgi:hypothetical protein
MKRDRVQSALQALAQAARRPHEPATLVLLRNALADRSNHVVGRAARAAREADLASLAPDLVAAFPRFLEDPIRCDPGCVAKREIVHALLAFSWPAPDVFLPGIVHVQREPAVGEPIDCAGAARAERHGPRGYRTPDGARRLRGDAGRPRGGCTSRRHPGPDRERPR